MQQTTSYGLCRCGCGQPTSIADRTRSDGTTKGEPRRYVSGHQWRCGSGDYTVTEDGCWLWQRGRLRTGYGRIYVPGCGMKLAHRVYYERAKGPIPVGLVIDHLCRAVACVNPDHLEAVSNAENVRRGDAAILTRRQVMEIKASPLGDRSLARHFGVAPSTINCIHMGRRWADIA